MKLLCSVDDAGRDRCTKKRGRMAPVSFSTSAWAEQCRLFALRAATRFAFGGFTILDLRLNAVAECLTAAFDSDRIFRSHASITAICPIGTAALDVLLRVIQLGQHIVFSE